MATLQIEAQINIIIEQQNCKSPGRSSSPLERFEEASRMMVDLHLAVAGEGVGGDLGQPEAASSNRLLTFLTLGRPLSVIDCETVISHPLLRDLSTDELEV